MHLSVTRVRQTVPADGLVPPALAFVAAAEETDSPADLAHALGHLLDHPNHAVDAPVAPIVVDAKPCELLFDLGDLEDEVPFDQGGVPFHLTVEPFSEGFDQAVPSVATLPSNSPDRLGVGGSGAASEDSGVSAFDVLPPPLVSSDDVFLEPLDLRCN